MNRYLVTYKVDEDIFAAVQTAMEIFNKMAMSDCFDISIVGIKWLKKYDNIEDFNRNGYPDCVFKGKWCCVNPETGENDPLRMEIISGDKLLDAGYAPEH